MRKKLTLWLSHGLVVLIAAIVSLPVSAEYPEKPIILIIPSGAGSNTDRLYRIVAEFLSDRINQSVVPVIVPGQSGLRGFEQLREASPDGYTIGAFIGDGGTASVFSLNNVSPIGMIARGHYVAYTSTDSNIGTLTAFRDQARYRNMRIGGQGLTGRSIVRSLAATLGDRLEVVTAKSPSDYREFLADQTIDLLVAPVSTALLRDGRFLSVASFGEKRPLNLPQTETALEAELKINASVVYGLVGPSDLPVNVVDTLQDALKEFVGSDEFRRELARTSADPEYQDAKGLTRETQTARNDFCTRCIDNDNCDDEEDCKEECPDCD